MAKLSKDWEAGTLHPRESIVGTGNLAAVNAEVVIDCHGSQTVSIDLRGTFSLTFEVNGTVDGTNWALVPVKIITGGPFLASVAGTAAGTWYGFSSRFRKLRVRCTAYTSGTAAVALVAGTGYVDSYVDGVTPSLGTITAAAGAAATLTLASPGAGLRHYITYLRIVRYAAAVLTPSATPVIVTTTNLPGTLAFTMPADAAAIGTVFTYQEDFANPIMAVAQATATTVVCPATTGVIWRVTAGFFSAP